jgi:hypothetical protein
VKLGPSGGPTAAAAKPVAPPRKTRAVRA